jgi:hypothetical protein
MSQAGLLLAKVEALIARSASTFPEEARTSAYLACKLMREKGLKVVQSAAGRAAEAAAPAAAPPRTDRQGPITCRARYSGKCKACRAPITVGMLIAWYPGPCAGAAHEAAVGGTVRRLLCHLLRWVPRALPGPPLGGSALGWAPSRAGVCPRASEVRAVPFPRHRPSPAQRSCGTLASGSLLRHAHRRANRACAP